MSDYSKEDLGESFGSLRFMGDRFKSANLPVSLLDNIKAYQEILFVLAEDIWRERNPENKRLPRGFRKNLSLSFSHIEDGSARAVLKSDSSIQAGLISDEFAINYMALAQTKFLQISKAANENKKVSGINSSAIKPLKTLISNLRDHESLEVQSWTGKDRQNNSVKYTEKTMRVLSNAAADKQIKSVQGIGIVRAIIDSTEEIEVLSEHGIFRLPAPSSQLRDNAYPIACFIEFEFQAVVSGNGRVKQIVEYGNLKKIESSAEHKRFIERLNHLVSLKAGWKDGLGESIDYKAAQYCFDLSGFICDIYSGISLFPELDGSLKVEFETKGLDVTIVCKANYIQLEVFSDDDDEPKEKVFFGLNSKLLSDVIDLESFAN